MLAAGSASAGHMLQLIREGHVRTRKELRDLTGLARSTVFQRVDALLAGGYIRESGVEASTGGRPAGLLTFNEDSGVVLAVDLGAMHCRLAVMDLAGHSLAEHSEDLSIELGPEPVLSRIETLLGHVLEASDTSYGQILGIGVGVPGPVEFTTGRVSQPPIMPGWHDYPIQERLAAYFQAPVLVDNDANIMALGEYTRCWVQESPAFLFVKVASGIGAGIVVGGELFRGIDGGAGDIGHVRLHEYGDTPCACGSTGCLAATASGSALGRRLTDSGHVARTSRDVAALVQAGDPTAVRLAREAGQLVGEVLATAVSLVNPGVLTIGGDLALTHEHFLTGVREELYRRSLPRSTRHLKVVASRLGDQAGIVGAATLAIDHVFRPAAVDARLAEMPLPANS